MIPPFTGEGKLPEGIHDATWDDFVKRFGWTRHRQRLLSGMYRALKSLRAAGCQYVYINGSFVTTKESPGDFDCCWDTTNVDSRLLDPTLLIFTNRRAAQKVKYFGEMFPASSVASSSGSTYLDFFQVDKTDGSRKGIIRIDLGVGL